MALYDNIGRNARLTIVRWEMGDEEPDFGCCFSFVAFAAENFCKIEMRGRLWASFAFGDLFAFSISISTCRFIENAGEGKRGKVRLLISHLLSPKLSCA